MILLVEDNDDDIFIMKRAIRRLPQAPSLQVAEDGREALSYLQGTGKYADRSVHPLPDLVFLDLKLPYVHGFEVLKWINQQPSLSHLPVVILSSSSEDRDRDKARDLGAKKFLVKPPTTEMLEEAIRLFARNDIGNG